MGVKPVKTVNITVRTTSRTSKFTEEWWNGLRESMRNKNPVSFKGG